MFGFLLAAGLKIGSSLLSGAAQDRAAKANAAAAKVDEASEFNTLALRGRQEQQQAAGLDQIADRKIQLDQGLADLASSENNVSGNSVGALANELQAQNGMYHDSVAENLSNQLQQIGIERQGVVSRTQARINGVQPPNPFATGLNIAGTALGAYTQYQGQQPSYGGSDLRIG